MFLASVALNNIFFAFSARFPNRMWKNLCERCHSEPFAVILSAAKDLALAAQGKLGEESPSGNPDLIGARFLVACGSSE